MILYVNQAIQPMGIFRVSRHGKFKFVRPVHSPSFIFPRVFTGGTGFSLTIHKSQGLTLPKAWIDIGKSERTAGVSYVAISRVKSLASCVIEPMTYERLTGLKSSANLQYRLEEENRLDQLAQATSSAFRTNNY